MSPDLRGQLDEKIWSQHGLISRRQAQGIGATRYQIDRLCLSGEWIRLGGSVYRHRSAPVTLLQRALAAVLKTGPGAAVSHQTAAFLWGLLDDHRGSIHLSVPRARWRQDGFLVHRSTDLAPHFVTDRQGIPTTTVARTIVDLGATASYWATERVLDSALRRDLTSVAEVTSLVNELGRQGRRGVGTARKLIAARVDWSTKTESELEDRFQRVISSWGLPSPVSQYEVRDSDGRFVGRVDFAYPGQRLLIEIDGFAFHSDPKAFITDRQRQNRLQTMGYVVLRFTAEDLRGRPEEVIRQVRGLLT